MHPNGDKSITYEHRALKTKDLGGPDLDPVWTQFANHFGFGRTSDPVLEAERVAIHTGDRLESHVLSRARARGRFRLLHVRLVL